MQGTSANIEVINPNSSRSVTEGIARELEALPALLSVTLDCTQIDAAPVAIESDADVALAERLVVEKVSKSTADAQVIACFSDPGVARLRGEGIRTVFGIAESAMHAAALLGESFGIISILEDSVARHAAQVARAGLSSRLAGDLALNLGVLDLAEPDLARPRLEKIGRDLRDRHGAEVLILGCAGMGGHRAWLQDLLGIPVVDPCVAGVATAVTGLAVLRPWHDSQQS